MTSPSTPLSSSPEPRPCFKVPSKAALQARLWDPCAINSFAHALLNDGVILIVPSIISNQHLTWFTPMPLSSCVISDIRASSTETALLITMTFAKHSSPPVDGSHHEYSNPQNMDSNMNFALGSLTEADFVGAPNEPFTSLDHYLRKVQLWEDSNRPFIVELHTGIEYFARIRHDLRIILSVGVQSASDRGRVTLHDFVYNRRDPNQESIVDRLGLQSEQTMDVLRDFLNDAVKVLAGPNMALIHGISFFSLDGIRYAKVELCRNVNACIEETREISYIRRATPAYETLSVCDKHVAAEAMRTVFDNTHEENVRMLFEGSCFPFSLYLKYDVAKAARVIPHRYAVNRRRYAGILAQRELEFPTAKDARYNKVRPTERIGRVDLDRRVVARHEWLVLLFLAMISAILAGIACFLVWLDSRVNAAEILTTGLAVLTGLMITLPQLYVSLQGGGYSLGDFYRGCVPMKSVMRRHGVSFLKECVAKGVNVEPYISGQHGCFLMLMAHGGLDVGPVQVKNLDDRWDYGLNKEGELCIRYRYKVGVMQVLTRWNEESEDTWKWWHCAVTSDEIVKSVRTAEVRELLGGGEIG